MAEVPPDGPTSWFLKFCESTLAAIALLSSLLIPLEFLPAAFFEQYGQYFGYLLIGMVVVALLSSLLYT